MNVFTNWTDADLLDHVRMFQEFPRMRATHPEEFVAVREEHNRRVDAKRAEMLR